MTLLGLAYPFLVLAGLRLMPPWALLGLPVLLLAARLALGGRGVTEVVLGAAVLVLAVLGSASPELALRCWPVLVSLGFAALFAASLCWGPPMAERFARSADPSLPDAARPYLRRVTWAWLGFLLANAAVAGWTAGWGSLALWSLYNGCLSYLLMGVMFAGEYAVRRLVRPA